MIESMGEPAFVCSGYVFNEDIDRIPSPRYNGHIMIRTKAQTRACLSNKWRRATKFPGVYVFRDRNSDECLYVGSSKNSMGGRALHHLRNEYETPLANRLKTQDLSEICIEFYPYEATEVLIEEMRAIVQWRPTCNKAIPGKRWGRS